MKKKEGEIHSATPRGEAEGVRLRLEAVEEQLRSLNTKRSEEVESKELICYQLSKTNSELSHKLGDCEAEVRKLRSRICGVEAEKRTLTSGIDRLVSAVLKAESLHEEAMQEVLRSAA